MIVRWESETVEWHEVLPFPHPLSWRPLLISLTIMTLVLVQWGNLLISKLFMALPVLCMCGGDNHSLVSMVRTMTRVRWFGGTLRAWEWRTLCERFQGFMIFVVRCSLNSTATILCIFALHKLTGRISTWCCQLLSVLLYRRSRVWSAWDRGLVAEARCERCTWSG